MKIIDAYGRTFKTLRVSLLSRCNLACVYCTSEEEMQSHNAARPTDEGNVQMLVDQIARLHSILGLEAVRLTGGEPTLYRHLVPLIEGIKAAGISSVKLTTNGFLLERISHELKNVGLDAVNVSLDAIDEDVFFLMSRRTNVQRVLNGIEAAIAAGIEVKINAVVMKGINHLQVLPLLEYAFNKNVVIRFLEVMRMGVLHKDGNKHLFSQDELLDVISKRYNIMRLARKTNATSNYWVTDSGKIFGIIANESEPFCGDCNRLRLDSEGNLYGCLSSNSPVPIKGITNEDQLRKQLQAALAQKRTWKFEGSDLSMLHIGG
jgi:cyclic pyranopterin phosphate synthase